VSAQIPPGVLGIYDVFEVESVDKRELVILWFGKVWSNQNTGNRTTLPTIQSELVAAQ
jgi:hypothetical protein